MPPVQLVLATNGRHYLHGTGRHSFCNTWVNTAQKVIMMKKLSRKSFIEAATCTAAKGRELKKVSSVEGNEECTEFFLLSS